ncbi:MAG: hypothetical protein JNM57_17035 [Cyclobacteriaceae bacterium]|nr:hypothetical protein [Cyclobacteriaceae bacterium]
MKNKVIILSIAVSLLTGVVGAQNIEKDDMYFNSKDRAKLNAQRTTEASYVSNYPNFKKKVDAMTNEADFINPTDSYSARNVNPEFTSRANSQLAREDNQDYFVSNYHYNSASNLNQFNNSYNNWYNNPWYNNSYFAPSMYSAWNRPWGYNGYYYDNWNNPWNSPYYQSGMTMSYYAGSPWCSGLSMGYNWGWGNSFYGSNFGYYGSRWNNWGYGNNIIIVNDGRNQVNYGKRPSRPSVGVNNVDDYSRSRRNAGNTNVNSQTGRENSGGRVASPDYSTGRTRQTSNDEYYVRPIRRTQESFNPSNPSRTNSNSNGSFSTPSRERSSSFDSSPSRSSTISPSSGSSGGSRSSSGSSGGSSGGSRRGQ